MRAVERAVALAAGPHAVGLPAGPEGALGADAQRLAVAAQRHRGHGRHAGRALVLRHQGLVGALLARAAPGARLHPVGARGALHALRLPAPVLRRARRASRSQILDIE